ncbi:uncharacterized protein LOC129602630 isoform X2 [Paramacrobiotus metropolitanus]|uniref:uncharacterized protein LOC129602630 isoform X2 n=1 Tax=Paramacrobiotus metropolitanus TaxID=2943436 RepID=UPI002445F260|nr:uncharacterized protein LOC129602630 isoform X2 [Paramacrobiotus metropolitanus]
MGYAKEVNFGNLFIINAAFQIIIGLALFGLDIAIFRTERAYQLYHTAGASGMWLGVVFLITGILGILVIRPACHVPVGRFLSTALYSNLFTAIAAFVLLEITTVMVTWAMASTRDSYAFQLMKAIGYLGMFALSLCQSIAAGLNIYRRSLLKQNSNRDTTGFHDNPQYRASQISVRDITPKVHKALDDGPVEREARYVNDIPVMVAPQPRYVEDAPVQRMVTPQPRYLEHHL